MSRARRRPLEVHPGELGPLVLAFVCFFCLLSASYVLRPMRDALGIEAGVHTYHWLFTGTFVATLVLYPALGAIASRTTRTRFASFVLGGVAASLLGFRALLESDLSEVALARGFFIWVSVFNVLLVSVFWGVMADVFSSEQGKRLYGPIAAGGTSGALAGPAMTRALAGELGATGLLLVAAGLLAVALGCVLALSPRRRRGGGEAAGPREPIIGGTTLAGLSRVWRSRYLLGITGYVVLLTATATFVYFQQGWIIERVLPDRDSRTELFATLDLVTNALTLLCQLLLTRRLLRRAGVAVALAVLPLVTGLGFAALAVAPVLVVLAGFQVIRRASEYAVARPAREVLFTVVSREDKFKAKNVIDVVAYRGSDAAFAWITAALAALGAGVGAVALTALPMCAAWLVWGVALGRSEARMAQAAPAGADRNPEEEAS